MHRAFVQWNLWHLVVFQVSRQITVLYYNHGKLLVVWNFCDITVTLPLKLLFRQRHLVKHIGTASFYTVLRVLCNFFDELS